MVIGLAFIGARPLAAQDQATQAYVVQKGDTLSKIAKRFYGKANLGSRLWRANQNLVAHPKKLTPGDVLYIFPESTLALNRPISLPPAPVTPPKSMYPKPDIFNMAFPKHFSFITDLNSHVATTRIRVKRLLPKVEVTQDPESGESKETVSHTYSDQLFEVRVVGEILASQERGAAVRNDGFDSAKVGRTLLSTGDNVIIRFNEDIRKIMDSDTYEDSDPYFTEFPIYAVTEVIQEPDRNSPSYGRSLGHLMYYRGTVAIVSRVEGLAPPPPMDVRRLKTRGKANRDLETVTYVARIKYSEDAIALGDKVLLFMPVSPGPERRLDAPFVESPDSYRAPGR
jgi:molybdopterin converting factor small subunit